VVTHGSGEKFVYEESGGEMENSFDGNIDDV
jgi:hypothetical protein